MNSEDHRYKAIVLKNIKKVKNASLDVYVNVQGPCGYSDVAI
jgi:hypothetical protein